MQTKFEYCPECGELTTECVCMERESKDDYDQNFKFEYAFESITEANSQFRKNTTNS